MDEVDDLGEDRGRESITGIENRWWSSSWIDQDLRFLERGGSKNVDYGKRPILQRARLVGLVQLQFWLSHHRKQH
jgi:hypothetical protein